MTVLRDPRKAPGWWKVQGRKFLIAVAVAAIAVVAAGWFTDLRQVMHGALLGIAVVAFLPLLIICGAILFTLVGSLLLLLMSVTGGDAAAGIEGLGEVGGSVAMGGAQLTPVYYGFLARQRHPLFWGGLCGVLLGGLLLWGLLAIVIIPGEARTVGVLAAAKAQVQAHYDEEGSFPRPDKAGHLVRDGHPLLDGFGRPLRYEVTGRWKMASWRLRSAGYDGEPSGDDLCIAGATRWVSVVEVARKVMQVAEVLASGEGSTRDEMSGVLAMQCD